MAALSDALLVVAMLGYLAAMIGYAAVYAFGDKGVVARVAERELVGAGGPRVVTSSATCGCRLFSSGSERCRRRSRRGLYAPAAVLYCSTTPGRATHRLPLQSQLAQLAPSSSSGYSSSQNANV